MPSAIRPWINGRPARGRRQSAPVTRPWDDRDIARVELATATDLEHAIVGAAAAFPVLRALPSHRRRTILLAVAEGIRTARAALGQLIADDAGKPVTLALGEVDRAISTFIIAAEELRHVTGEVLPADVDPRGEGLTALTLRYPLGPVAAISRFTFPLNLVAHKVAPAIAAGCPVVLKVPPQAPLASFRLAEILAELGRREEALDAGRRALEVEPHVGSKMGRVQAVLLKSRTCRLPSRSSGPAAARCSPSRSRSAARPSSMDNDLSLILSNALFGDGAAAAVVQDRPDGWELAASACRHAPEHRDTIRYVHKKGRLHNQLSLKLPELVKQAAADAIAGVLAARGLKAGDVQHWALHTGGEKIINAVRDAVGIPEDRLGPVRRVLREYGNMSSPTVWFVLDEVQRGGVAAGDWCVMAAYGAGLSAHAFLLRRAGRS